MTHFRDIQFVTIFVFICVQNFHPFTTQRKGGCCLAASRVKGCSFAAAVFTCAAVDSRRAARLDRRRPRSSTSGRARLPSRFPRVRGRDARHPVRAERRAEGTPRGLGYCWPAPVPRERHGTLRLPRDPRRGRGPREVRASPRRPPARPLQSSRFARRSTLERRSDPPPPSRSLAAAPRSREADWSPLPQPRRAQERRRVGPRRRGRTPEPETR